VREDLRTRLASGVSLRLAPLDDTEKSAALASHGAQRGLRLGPFWSMEIAGLSPSI